MPVPIQLMPWSLASVVSANLSDVPIQARLLFIGVLFLGTLAVSRFSIRLGIPGVLGVLLLGLLVNVNYLDITHVEAENLQIFALALLLFYAGLKTDLKAIRGFLEYGLLLALGGVMITSLALGGLIWWLSSATGGAIALGFGNGIPLGAAFLVAACLGSTDAGATLSVLAQVRPGVPLRLQHLLEFESAVNDPAALLVYGLLIELFTSAASPGASAGSGAADPYMAMALLEGLKGFVQQIGSGLIVGVLFGYVAKFVIDYLVHERAQLLVVAMSIAFIDYGVTDLLGGSGFVAVYVTGVFMTNMNYRLADVNHETIQEVLLPFNTMTEITVFLIFGLLVSPADLLGAVPMGIAAAGALMLVARPLGVLLFQPFSPFSRRESTLIAWCGLRGAVPLALSYHVVSAIPQLRGLDPALAEPLAHNAQGIVFVVVVLNLLLQGFTLPRVCRGLGLSAGAAGP
ncbi:cell volume regulation protein CvrA [Cyanobium sp. PCC 7001]|uniref:cation:proton antiporter domain-containing protein n=1 Tax=Cyanobium sp. PCC 7001 TaxID=180281 RepID=UPI0001805A8A|nr:cation:proton antiporter [Cyanobium sp. PCC 7001]EDY37807.1 cell volume regulation protein CvrA [Cyanobium sp. PCC 7001]